MKFFRLDLLTLLISLFILNSCKNENTVGLLPGTQSISGTIVDTASVYTNTSVDDTVATSNISKLPLGYIVDPVFGTTESDMITDLNLPGSTAYIAPIGVTVIDSAVLVLQYADGFYGDSLINYTINAYQLNERPYAGISYYDNKRWNYNKGNLVGSLTFQPRPLDTLKIDTVVHGSKDTLIKVAPQIRIPISHDFIEANLFEAGTAQLGSDLVFQNNVKGFFLTVDKSSIAGTGGMMMFKPPGNNALQVYIRTTNGSVVDTSVVYLNVALHATQINHVYSAQVQNALNLTAQNAANHTNIPDSLIYLQGNGGLRSKISFPYLKKLFSTIPGGLHNVVINRAELVVTVPHPSLTGDIPAYLVPLPKLTLYHDDITGQPFSVEDATTGSNVFFGVGEFGGYYSTKTYNYHFLITSYLQNILNGTTVDYGTYIAPVDTTNTSSVDIAPTIQTSARTVGIGFNNKTYPGYRIKLNVIYTKIKQ